MQGNSDSIGLKSSARAPFTALALILIANAFAAMAATPGLVADTTIELTAADDLGDDYLPSLCVYNDRLYLVWVTDDTTISNGNDTDVVMCWYDGASWSSIVEITTDDNVGTDWRARLCVYEDELYVVWETTDATISNGTDYDIVMKRYNAHRGELDDADAWSEAVEVSGDEILPQDDYNPHPVVYMDRLYIAWQSWQAGDADIALRCYDHGLWHNVTSPTPDDKGNDFDPSVAVYDGGLWVAWRTNDSVASTGEDWDIVARELVLRETGDGAIHQWNNLIELSAATDTGDDLSPAVAVHDDALWFLWGSDDETYTGGKDEDILLRSYNNTLSAPMELTSQKNEGSDKHPLPVIYDDRLYIIWRTDDVHISDGADWDIVMTYYGSKHLPVELTNKKDRGDDAGFWGGVDGAVFGDKLYVAWQSKDTVTTNGVDWDIVVISLNPSTEVQDGTVSRSDATQWRLLCIALIIVSACLIALVLKMPRGGGKEKKRKKGRAKRRAKW